MRWIDLKARRRVDELQDGLDSLKRKFQDLELEWANTYDKLRTMMGRVAKRAAVVENTQLSGGPGGEGDAQEDAGAALFPGLTARQRHLQASILRRRSGMQPKPNGEEGS